MEIFGKSTNILPQYSGTGFLRRRAVARVTIITALVTFCFVYGFYWALVAPRAIPIIAAPLCFLGLLVIWALPEMKRPPTAILSGLFFAFFIMLMIWPNYLAIALPGLPWITMSRLTGFPLVFVFIVCVAVSSEFRGTLGRILAQSPLTWKLLAVFVLIQLVSIIFSKDRGSSFQKFTIQQITWTFTFFISCYIFTKPKKIVKWAKILWAAAVIQCLIGFQEHRLSHVVWAGHVPSILKSDDELSARILAGTVRFDTGKYRTQGTFSTSLGLSEFLALAFPFVVYFSISKQYSKYINILAFLTLPMMLLVVNYTDSRFGLISCLLSILLYIFLLSMRSWKSRKESFLSPAIALAYPAIFSLSISAVVLVPKLRKIFLGNAANDARVTQYKTGLPMVLSHPWGYGLGMGAETLNYSPLGFVTIDTYYLDIALQFGVFGFIVFYSMIGVSIFHSAKYSYKRNSSDADFELFLPLAVSMVIFLVIKSVFSQVDNHAIIFMMMGGIVALIYRMAIATKGPSAVDCADSMLSSSGTQAEAANCAREN